MPRDFRRAFRLDRRSADDAGSSVDDELTFHLEEAEEELVAAGWDPAHARLEAARRFGDLDGTRAYCTHVQTRMGRKERAAMSLEDLGQDIRYALRTLRAAPGYTAVVVLTLAFGIAANTTIFSIMGPYMLRALPYGEPDQLVQVNQVNPVTGWDMDRFSWPQYEDWRARTRAFDGLAAYTYGSSNVSGPEGPEKVAFARVSSDLFEVLRAEPVLGRSFVPEEGGPGAEPVVVLSDGWWRRRYAADPGLIGRTITLDGTAHTVIGVMPPRFNFPFGSARLWVPIREGADAPRTRNAYQFIGRLAPGWSAERARSELSGIQAELAALYPDEDGRMSGVTVKPLREALNFAWDVMSISFRILLGAVGFVLLIACVNVAGLALARGSGRTREVAVRVAMGAPRGRIVRQLLTESLALATLGGAVGVGLSALVTRAVGPVLPEDLYRIGDVAIDGTALLFTAGVTALTAIAFGLAPALEASRVDLTSSLKEGSRGSGSATSSRGRRALVVVQVSLAVVLITGAGLMLRSLGRVQDVDLGFDPTRVLATEVQLPENDYPTAGERAAFVDRAVATLASVPGVTDAAAATWLPLNHETYTFQVASSDQAGAPGDEWPLAILNDVYPGYFGTLDIDLLEGRDFAALDGPDAERVVVVNRSLADRLWPSGSAVGRTLLAGNDPTDAAAYAVVGVVEDVRHSDLSGAAAGPQLYRPTLQGRATRYFLLARTGGDPADLVPAVRATLREAEPNLPAEIRPMTDVVRENLLQWSLSGGFLAVFGAGALLLATLGIYGLVAFSVSQRKREIGVRIALGASRRQILREVVGGGVRLTALGLAVGLAAALGLGRLAASILYDVSPFDLATLASVLALFLAVAALASYLPARRASRTDPIGVLRAE